MSPARGQVVPSISEKEIEAGCDLVPLTTGHMAPRGQKLTSILASTAQRKKAQDTGKGCVQGRHRAGVPSWAAGREPVSTVLSSYPLPHQP